MDVRSSGLVVLVYAVFGVIVAGVAAVGWVAWPRSGNTAAMLDVDSPDPGGARRLSRRADEAHLHQRQEAFAEAARRIHQLERLLERKTELLNQRTELLNQRTADYDALRSEADRYLMLLLEQLEPQMPETLDPDAPAGEPTDDPASADQEARDTLQAELRRLRAELARSDLLEEALSGELEQVRRELETARDQLAEAEIDQLLGGDSERARPLATEALVRIGAEATPILTTALRDERPDIRRWAAEVLEQLGPAAAAALPALRTARDDTDPAVRQAARRALAAVNAVEP